MVNTQELKIKTKGNTDVIDITSEVQNALEKSTMSSGIVNISNIGSTASITTVEYEPGLAKHDLKAAFEKFAPENGHYEHEKTWNDDNGHAHVRASFIGPSVTLPFTNKKLLLGTWQQIILIDFDTRERNRNIICQFIGD